MKLYKVVTFAALLHPVTAINNDLLTFLRSQPAGSAKSSTIAPRIAVFGEEKTRKDSLKEIVEKTSIKEELHNTLFSEAADSDNVFVAHASSPSDDRDAIENVSASHRAVGAVSTAALVAHTEALSDVHPYSLPSVYHDSLPAALPGVDPVVLPVVASNTGSGADHFSAGCTDSDNNENDGYDLHKSGSSQLTAPVLRKQAVTRKGKALTETNNLAKAGNKTDFFAALQNEEKGTLTNVTGNWTDVSTNLKKNNPKSESDFDSGD